MANKQKENPSNEQDTVQAKELQKFFNRLKGVMLVPGEKKFHGFEYPVLSLLFDEATYINFKHYRINNNIVDLLDNKYPILCVRIDESDKVMAGLSIIDNDSGLRFTLPDQPICPPLLAFVQTTIPISKIVTIAGYIKDGQILFDKDIKEEPLLILDGFIFE